MLWKWQFILKNKLNQSKQDIRLTPKVPSRGCNWPHAKHHWAPWAILIIFMPYTRFSAPERTHTIHLDAPFDWHCWLAEIKTVRVTGKVGMKQWLEENEPRTSTPNFPLSSRCYSQKPLLVLFGSYYNSVNSGLVSSSQWWEIESSSSYASWAKPCI